MKNAKIVTWIPLLVAACAPSGPPPDVVIRAVSVVDVASGEIRAGQSVAIRGNRIVYVGPGSGGAGDSTTVIDGAGAYAIPGLWDMHVHALNPGGNAFIMKSFVANGITGFRDTWGSLDVARETRRAGESGEYPVPRFILSGNLVDGPNPIWPTSLSAESPERGRAIVDSLVDAGAGFIKVYSKLAPDVFRAIAQRAGERDIAFAGHVPTLVTTREASSLGQRTMEHLNGVIQGCSTAEDENHRELNDFLRRPSASENVGSRGELFERLLGRALDSQDGERCREQFAVFAANETWQVPTLVTLRGVRHIGDPEFQRDPRLAYVPAAIRSFWSPRNGTYQPMASETQQRAMLRERELVGMMHDANVPLLAGSDTPNPYAFYGFGLHDELSLFVASGVPPLDALRAATTRPAEFLGTTDSLGAVAVNRIADLVLLEGNPLDDIENVRRIRGVVLNGRYYDRAALDRMLEEVKQEVAGP